MLERRLSVMNHENLLKLRSVSFLFAFATRQEKAFLISINESK